MKLRKELEPLERTQEFKELLKNKIENIEYLIENNMDCKRQISDFNRLTGRSYDKHYFQTYWEAISLEDFVNNVCNPEPKKVSDITKRVS